MSSHFILYLLLQRYKNKGSTCPKEIFNSATNNSENLAPLFLIKIPTKTFKQAKIKLS